MTASTTQFHLLLLSNILISLLRPYIIVPVWKTFSYTSDPLPATIHDATENFVSTLTSHRDSPPIDFCNYETPTMDHIIMRYGCECDNPKRGYCDRPHNGIIFYQKRVILLQIYYS